MFIALFLIFLILLAVELFAPNATASPIHEQASKSLTNKAPYKLERSDQTTTTTTTSTTTLPPVKKKVVQPAETKTPSQVALPPVNNLSHLEMMNQAGIDPKDQPYMEAILQGENADWNPCKRNGGIIDCNYVGSKAYGIPQALPGSKMAGAGADWKTNPITQLRWMDMYCNQEKFPQAKSAYPNWAAALAHKKSFGWY